MGDALAVTLSVLKGFRPEDFARFHPGAARAGACSPACPT